MFLKTSWVNSWFMFIITLTCAFQVNCCLYPFVSCLVWKHTMPVVGMEGCWWCTHLWSKYLPKCKDCSVFNIWRGYGTCLFRCPGMHSFQVEIQNLFPRIFLKLRLLMEYSKMELWRQVINSFWALPILSTKCFVQEEESIIEL